MPVEGLHSSPLPSNTLVLSISLELEVFIGTPLPVLISSVILDLSFGEALFFNFLAYYSILLRTVPWDLDSISLGLNFFLLHQFSQLDINFVYLLLRSCRLNRAETSSTKIWSSSYQLGYFKVCWSWSFYLLLDIFKFSKDIWSDILYFFIDFIRFLSSSPLIFFDIIFQILNFFHCCT